MNTRDRSRWLPIAILAVVAILLTALDTIDTLDGVRALVRDPLAGVLAFTSAQTDKIADALRGPRELAAAQALIDDMQAQIDALGRENEALREVAGEYQLLLDLFEQQQDSVEFDRVLARVIARDPSPTFRSFIIDKGSDDGVFVGMPVESARGLVGQIFRTTNSLAQVILITDNTSSVPARLGQSRATGIVHGGGVGGVLTMDWIDLEAQISLGDPVLTSGLVGDSPTGMVVNRFPPDLILGRVVDVQRSEAELFQRAIVQPATDFESLELVFVIRSYPTFDTTIFEEPPGG